MTSSEPYVAIPDCKIVDEQVRSFRVECPHFPSGAAFVHKGLLSPVHGIYLDGEPFTMVVLKRFVLHQEKVSERAWTEDLPEAVVNEEEE